MPKIIGIRPRIQRFVDLEKMAMETAETKPEETAVNEEPTIESIKQYLTDQGNYLEVQIKSEPYEHCPVCAVAKEFMEELCRMIEAIILGIEERQKLSESAEFPAPEGGSFVELQNLKQELQWYELSKTAMSHMAQAGHMPESVMRQHPELVVSKAQKRKIRSGKHKKQIAKESRRKNRH